MANSFELFTQVNVGSCKVRPDTVVDVCFGCTGAVQTWTVPATKQYCIEAWGAQGGGGLICTSGGHRVSGALGAYAAGKICLTQGCTLNIYVGGEGCCSNCFGCHTVCGGYNGGGAGGGTCYSGQSSSTGGGGGGTDVRYNGTTLCNRFIVAGGGAGGASGCCGSSICCFQNGGGGATCGCGAWPGTQTAAGRCGGFGQGANARAPTNYRSTAPGGGGGRYGGGGCYCDDCYAKCSTGALRCGSGGSSYTYTSSTCGNHPCKACLGNLPLMTDAVCCSSWCSFPSPSGGTETGHRLSGCVRIRSV